MTGEYRQYLNSPIWWEKRDRILERDGWRCRICGSTGPLNVHHLRYPEVLGEELDEDLITLCEACHAEVHAEDIKRKNEKEKRNQYYKKQHELLAEWINEAKREDFLYGGMVNMCRPSMYEESIEEFNKKHDCDLQNGRAIQSMLGLAHWFAVNELHSCGFTVEDIKLIMPLERQMIDKYLQKDRIDELYRNQYSDEIITVVKEYIRDEMSRRHE